jgi:hypothetical protein
MIIQGIVLRNDDSRNNTCKEIMILGTNYKFKEMMIPRINLRKYSLFVDFLG